MSEKTFIDVREIPKPSRHKLIFEKFNTLAQGETLLLINDHEPLGLLREFEREIPGSFAWDSLGADENGDYRVCITRLTKASLPRVMANSAALGEQFAADGARGGAVWGLNTAERGLDANLVMLQPNGVIEKHIGPSIDVVIHVFAGSGTIEIETGEVLQVKQGDVVWYPKLAERRIVAGADGLQYFSVHTRKHELGLMPAMRKPSE